MEEKEGSFTGEPKNALPFSNFDLDQIEPLRHDPTSLPAV